MSRRERIDKLMDLALTNLERRLAEGEIDAATFNAVLRAFNEAGFTLATEDIPAGLTEVQAKQALLDEDYSDILN